MITQKEICGVVVWYNPTTDNVTAINTYLENISHLFIVDNSTTDNSALINTLPNNKITYLPNLENLGIATALNIGCEAALNANAKWILTMDQDSKFDRFSLSDFITEANQCPTFDKVGIFSPYHYCGEVSHKKRERFQTTLITMTSGNLLRTEAYCKCGRFRDDFFIDLVDKEYCCQLYRNSYTVVKTNRIIITHSLGNGFVRVSPLFQKTFIQHSALRHYYIVRNLLEVRRLYPEHKKYYSRQLRKRLKRCLLYNSDQKWTKIKYMYWGWRDYKKRIFGKINH